jgi:hypothetical protein
MRDGTPFAAFVAGTGKDFLDFLVDTALQFVDLVKRDPMFVCADIPLIGKVTHDLIDALA